MASRLLPCPRCARHVFAREAACPFCAFSPSLAIAAAATLATTFALASCGDRTGLDVASSHDAASDAAHDGGADADASGARDSARDAIADAIGFDATPIPFDAGDSGPIPIYGSPPPPGSARAGHRTPDE